MPKALVFGGMGQIGSAITQKLSSAGWDVVVPTRRITASNVTGIKTIPFSLTETNVREAMNGVDAIINCIGILAPHGKDTFDSIHRDLPTRLAMHATQNGVKHFVHLSAIGADIDSPSSYARSKAEGESAIKYHFPEAIVFRPSIVFGPNDSFFNRFAQMARVSPFLPLIGGGRSHFQPVYVNDVADAVTIVLSRPDAKGQIFHLGGPKIYSFRELMEFILKTTGNKRILLSLPWQVAEIQALILEHLPGKILTRDQLKLLRTDNVVASGALGLSELGISPKSIEDIVPTYICAA